MTAAGFLNVTFLSGSGTGQTADVPIAVAEDLMAVGYAKVTAAGEPAGDPDPVFVEVPALDK